MHIMLLSIRNYLFLVQSYKKRHYYLVKYL